MGFYQLGEDGFNPLAQLWVAVFPPPGVVPGVFLRWKHVSQTAAALTPDDLWLAELRPSSVELVVHSGVVEVGGFQQVLDDFTLRRVLAT